MVKAVLIIDSEFVISENEKIDLNLWRVPKDKDYSDGLKYSVNYRVFADGKWTEKIRIDNKERHGHHLHFLGERRAYEFVSFEKVVEDVKSLIKKLKGGG